MNATVAQTMANEHWKNKDGRTSNDLGPALLAVIGKIQEIARRGGYTINVKVAGENWKQLHKAMLERGFGIGMPERVYAPALGDNALFSVEISWYSNDVEYEREYPTPKDTVEARALLAAIGNERVAQWAL